MRWNRLIDKTCLPLTLCRLRSSRETGEGKKDFSAACMQRALFLGKGRPSPLVSRDLYTQLNFYLDMFGIILLGMEDNQKEYTKDQWKGGKRWE